MRQLHFGYRMMRQTHYFEAPRFADFFMFDLNHISHFLAVLRHGHFGRAAEEMHISQSALSRSIQALEKKVGQQLLVRSRGRVRPTAKGEIVAVHGEQMLRQRMALLAELDQHAVADEGEIRIGLGAFPAEQAGVAAASPLVGSRGDLLCQLRIGDYREITQDILAQRIDLGFCDLAAAREEERIACLPTHRWPLYCYTRRDHPLQEMRNPSFEDILDYQVIGVRKPKRINIETQRGAYLDELTGEWLPVLNTVNPDLVLKLLAVSNAVAFAPLALIGGLLEQGEVALVHSRVPGLHLDLGFIHLVDRPPEKLGQRYMAEVTRIEAELITRTRYLERRFGAGNAKRTA
jgi:DNA-binding transcriptional LysR family regulator